MKPIHAITPLITYAHWLAHEPYDHIITHNDGGTVRIACQGYAQYNPPRIIDTPLREVCSLCLAHSTTLRPSSSYETS